MNKRTTGPTRAGNGSPTARPGIPLFWIESPGGYRLRTMAQIIDMPWDWPVEVNYLEAKAFCNWLARKTGKPLRLPTEAEWYRLRDLHDIRTSPTGRRPRATSTWNTGPRPAR